MKFPAFAALAILPLSWAATFTNPVLWEDLADLEVIRVNSTYYYTASTMHFSPGAPVLRSQDLVNWEYISHSVPSLSFGSKYDLTNGHAYVKGIWASSLAYRMARGLFYWIGCIQGGATVVYTASDPAGQWTKAGQLSKCYYDAGMFVDDNDTIYVAWGQNNIHVSQLSADGLSEVRDTQVFSWPTADGLFEGSRMFKRNGKYYITCTKPANEQHVLQASSPFGPYTRKQLLVDMAPSVTGAGIPHQGGFVDTQDGKWYYMAFIDAYPGGRIPVLAPLTWGSDGFPVVQTVSGAWGKQYDYPLPQKSVASPVRTDRFPGPGLAPNWEWNHNPDTSKFTVSNGLTLKTVTVTPDLYKARNTLTHRILGPQSTATIEIDISTMAAGDNAGLAILRDSSAWVGIKQNGGTKRVSMVSGITMTSDTWNTASTGSEIAGTNLASNVTKVWLRVTADITPGTGRQAKFSWSSDGANFQAIGQPLTMGNAWQFFMGHRFAIFNYATQAPGGSVKVNSFAVTKP